MTAAENKRADNPQHKANGLSALRLCVWLCDNCGIELFYAEDNRISMDNYIYNSRSFHRLVETITHAPTMSTVKTM